MQKRATEIFKLSDGEIKSLPTENLETERYLAKFGWLASQSAARSNKNFKAQRIRDDLMFETNKKAESLNKKNLAIFKNLKSMEMNWTTEQKEQIKIKIRANLEKQKRKNEYVESNLKKCKSHNGPFTSIEELQRYVNKKPKDLQKNLRYEIIFKRQLNSQDFQIRPSLYKVNRMTVDELLTNLTILLATEEVGPHEEIDLPSQEEMMKILRENQDIKDIQSFYYQQPLAVKWDETETTKRWYLGFYLNGSMDTTLKVDHLTPDREGKEYWKRPAIDVIQDVFVHQVVPITIDGEWVQSSSSRSLLFQVKNWQDVEEKFSSFF